MGNGKSFRKSNDVILFNEHNQSISIFWSCIWKLIILCFRPDNVKNEAETYWLTVFESGLDVASSDVKVDVNDEKSESLKTSESSRIEKQEKHDQNLDNVDDESQTGIFPLFL